MEPGGFKSKQLDLKAFAINNCAKSLLLQVKKSLIKRSEIKNAQNLKFTEHWYDATNGKFHTNNEDGVGYRTINRKKFSVFYKTEN